MMYKLRIYKLKGLDKGNLDHEEFFKTKPEMESRYKEIVRRVSEKLPEHKRQAYFPMVWEETENGWDRIEGY